METQNLTPWNNIFSMHRQDLQTNSGTTASKSLSKIDGNNPERMGVMTQYSLV